MRTQVDTAPLRAAFERSGLTARELATRMGWTRPDSNRVTKALGMTPYHPGHGFKPKLREQMLASTATELAKAMDVDPVDVGL